VPKAVRGLEVVDVAVAVGVVVVVEVVVGTAARKGWGDRRGRGS
jgi:hypothetical protein